MSREQWGHGYWKGVADAQSGKIRKNFLDEVKYWIAMMCAANEYKSYDRGIYSVSEFMYDFDLSEKYAKRIYDYIFDHNTYEFEPNVYSWCYVSGLPNAEWFDDYFVIPYGRYRPEKWNNIIDEFREKWGWFSQDKSNLKENK